MPVHVRFTAIRANSRVIPGPETYAALHDYTLGYCGNIIIQLAYPPPPEMPSYKRTYRLLRNWKAQDMSSGAQIQYRIINPTQDKWGRYYSGYVHGPNQTSFHAAHGHKNLQDLVDHAEFRQGAQAIIEGVAI